MKKNVFFILIIVCFMSCATRQKPLYSWYNYDNYSYNYLKKADEQSTLRMIETYENIIEKQEGSRGVVPPGICAEYGFLLLQMDKIEEGKAMLLKEISLYPESKIFIDRILKIIEQ